MRRAILTVLACLGMSSAGAWSAQADVGDTQVDLSCSDGHSVILSVDQATLTNLVADVTSINASGAGLTCSVDTPALDPSAASGDWTVYDYNPSGHGIRPRRSPDSMPATSSGGNASFQFIPGTFTALLVTTSGDFTGDLSGSSLSDTVTWSNTGGFMEQNGGGCVPDQQFVRFYFQSPSASGPSTGTPPAGFYTQFWWSNPVHVDLVGDDGGSPMTAPLAWPAAAGQWSDWNGQENDSSPAATEAFKEATHKVKTIGVSFGGGCFFENGLTTITQGPFTSSFAES